MSEKLGDMDSTRLLSTMSEGYVEGGSVFAPVQYVSWFSTLMNVLNTLIGAEILGIPNSMTFCGLVPSVLLLLLTACLSYIATIQITRLQNRFSATSINDLTEKLLGRTGGICLSILTLIFTYSLLVAYLVTAAETIESWFKVAGLPQWASGWRRAVVIGVYTICLPIPLTCPRRMDFLNTASTFAIFCLFFYCVVMIIKGSMFFAHNEVDSTVETGVFNLGFFNAFSIDCLMFALPGIVLPLLIPYHPNLTKRYYLVSGAFIMCFILTIVPGTIGYLMFGAKTDQIIFHSFDDKDVLMQCTRVAFFVVLNASYPVVGMTVIAELFGLVFKNECPAKAPLKQRIVILAFTNIPPAIIAMLLPKVRPALAVGGALGGCLTNFFVPPVLWIKQSKEKWCHWSIVLNLLFIMFGVVCAVIATYEAILDAINTFKHPAANDITLRSMLI